MLEHLELSRFEGLVGQYFELIREDSDAVNLELTEAGAVGELSAKQAAKLGKRMPFSLVFRGLSEQFMPQGIQTLRHPELVNTDTRYAAPPRSPPGNGATD